MASRSASRAIGSRTTSGWADSSRAIDFWTRSRASRCSAYASSSAFQRVRLAWGTVAMMPSFRFARTLWGAPQAEQVAFSDNTFYLTDGQPGHSTTIDEIGRAHV